jgi:hypothetical protein
VRIVVKVTEQEAARLLRPHEGHPAIDSSVLATARQAGAAIAPEHPGVTDPVLSRYFVARLAEPGAAEALVTALLALSEVEGAYLKPDEEPATNQRP